jgi:hypothetical protein
MTAHGEDEGVILQVAHKKFLTEEAMFQHKLQ